jgi:hypothetical protein
MPYKLLEQCLCCGRIRIMADIARVAFKPHMFPLKMATKTCQGMCRVLVGKPEGKRPLGRPRCRWEDNIRMDLQEVGCGDVD